MRISLGVAVVGALVYNMVLESALLLPGSFPDFYSPPNLFKQMLR